MGHLASDRDPAQNQTHLALNAGAFAYRLLSMMRLLILLLALGHALAQETPRLLLVDVDDLGFDLLEQVETPTFDRLSEEGLRFTQFHSTPLCSPTRSRALLGAYGSRPGVELGTIIRMRKGQFDLPLDAYQPLPRILKNAGLRSAKVGKWHLCNNAKEDHPILAGFDDYTGVMSNIDPPGWDYSHFLKVIKGKTVRQKGKYATTDETDDTIERLEQGYDFVWLSYHAIHIPFHVPPAELAGEGPFDTDQKMAAAMLRALDHELGRLLVAAEREGYTVIIAADNGTARSIGGEKGMLSASGVFVPAWAIGPGVVPGVDHGMADWADLYGTVCEWLDVSREDTSRQGPDSISFASRLRGDKTPTRDRLYSEMWKPNGSPPSEVTRPNYWSRSLRSERWSLRVHDGVPGHRLHDRAADPHEEIDLLLSPLEDEAKEAYHGLCTELGIEPLNEGSGGHPVTILLLDDVSAADLGSAETPNIDGLLERSARFVNAWGLPSDSAARASLLTGELPTQNGVGHDMIWKGRRGALPLEAVTLAEYFDEPVHFIGKWNVSFDRKDPNAQGFDHFVGTLGALSKAGTGPYDWRRSENGRNKQNRFYVTRVTTDDALAAESTVRVVAYHRMEETWEDPPGVQTEDPEARHRAHLEYLDSEIGRLLDGVGGYVILISDQASNAGELAPATLGIPFAVSGPDVVPGERTDFVQLCDVLPTVLELRGVEGGRGLSFVSALRGEAGLRSFLEAERIQASEETGDETLQVDWAVRSGGYLLVCENGQERLTEVETGVALPEGEQAARIADELRSLRD